MKQSNTPNRIESISKLIPQSRRNKTTESYIDCRAVTDEFFEHSNSIDSSSGHNYPEKLIELINAPSTKWALDCGAGSRVNPYSNVVTFDIEAYSGTDVIGVAENLPFHDNSFDLVFSLAVLEHVKEPKKAASEMQRVLKPGGFLWIDTAFIQPYHAYPAHYFNMTQEGLESLLNSDMTIIRDTVPRYGTPIWSISWILNMYANALANDTREKFTEMRIADLLESPERLCEQDYAQQLPEAARKALAATVSILATKETNHQPLPNA